MTDLGEQVNAIHSSDEEEQIWPENVDVVIQLPGHGGKKTIVLPDVSSSETLSAIRQALGDFQETAFLTAFKWELKYLIDINGNKIDKSQEVINDFTELNSFLESTAKKCYFELSEDSYDTRKVRNHIKRFKDIINRSFLVSASPKDQKKSGNKDGNDASRDRLTSNDSDELVHQELSQLNLKEKKDSSKSKNGQSEKTPTDLPKFEQSIQSPSLGNFFEKAFVSTNTHHKSPSSSTPSVELLSNVIKSVFISGWNPPPSYRRLQGDLLYIEVSLGSEGTLYLTATSKGFYINKSNRNSFDPKPTSSTSSFYCHNLFDTLLHYSATLRHTWSNFCKHSNSMNFALSGPLEPLQQQYQIWNGDVNTLPTASHSWLIPSPLNESCKSSYDLYRTNEYLCDLYGAEELGAPREWNDEIQSIRSLSANELGEKVVKARLEYRIISDFTENCKKIVLGISEGLISPLTYADPTQSNIFIYNGICISRAEDTKDSFKLCVGEEAARKATARDMLNQKLLKSLEIDNLGTVLCTIIDYKGIRYVGQSIIPGIFNQGENCASLMYGVLEANKNITVSDFTTFFFFFCVCCLCYLCELFTCSFLLMFDISI
jgi:protein TIF31